MKLSRIEKAKQLTFIEALIEFIIQDTAIEGQAAQFISGWTDGDITEMNAHDYFSEIQVETLIK